MRNGSDDARGGDASLCWLHFGDLHVEDAESRSLASFRALVDVANAQFATGCDFAFLPGDNANDAQAAQFDLVREAAERITHKLLVIPGDHDGAEADTRLFHEHLAGPAPFPRIARFPGFTVALLDIVSAGGGGPHFRIAPAPLAQLDDALAAARARGDAVVVLTHAYPADMPDGAGEALAALIARHDVRFVDMGHTHYNEIGNDGATIWSATRSTGQIEEGGAGFAVACLDNGQASWRFRAEDATGPFVLITSPADDRLRTSGTPLASGLRAKVWSTTPVSRVAAVFGSDAPVPMARVGGDGPCGIWSLDARPRDAAPGEVRVVATDANGAEGADAIRIGGAAAVARPPADGSDRHRIEPWPERGIVGGQLGPNRNGRPW